MKNYAYNPEEDYEHVRPTLEEAIQVLKSGGDPVPDETIIYGLSELTKDQISIFRPIWLGLDPSYRLILIEILVDEMQSNYELDYEAIGLLGLEDSNPRIRQSGVELVSESEDIAVMDQLIGVLKSEVSHEVRQEITRVLGNFILQGEVGDLPEEDTERAQKIVLALYKNLQEDVEIRARALEAIANCSHPQINQFIKESYNSDDPALKLGAVVAMGRTADTTRWDDIVLEELENGVGEMQLEAARASGELQLGEAIPHLALLIQEGERDAQEVAIWALGEIGGKEATRILESAAEDAEEAEDEEMLELIEDALSVATVIGSGRFLGIDLDD